MNAIVYTSNTGHTKQYAELLSQITGLPCLDFKAAKKQLGKTDEVVYFGWVMAGSVKNAEKASDLFSVKAVCAVGFSTESTQIEKLKSTYSSIATVFYLMGGIDTEKLHGFQKMIINMIRKSIEKKRENGGQLSEDDIKSLEYIKTGKNLVSEENLKNVLAWYDGVK